MKSNVQKSVETDPLKPTNPFQHKLAIYQNG